MAQRLSRRVDTTSGISIGAPLPVQAPPWACLLQGRQKRTAAGWCRSGDGGGMGGEDEQDGEERKVGATGSSRANRRASGRKVGATVTVERRRPRGEGRERQPTRLQGKPQLRADDTKVGQQLRNVACTRTMHVSLGQVGSFLFSPLVGQPEMK